MSFLRLRIIFLAISQPIIPFRMNSCISQKKKFIHHVTLQDITMLKCVTQKVIDTY